jgi:predicted ATPase
VHHWGPEPSAEDAELWRDLWLETAYPRPQGGIWLRAESMHELFASVDRQAIELRAFDGVPLNTRSHGEGFLAFLESRVMERGLWILDDGRTPCPPPLASSRRDPAGGLTAAGSQVILATHSPVLASFPGATLYELDGSGFATRQWADLDLVQDWQAFFDDPARLLRHLLDD